MSDDFSQVYAALDRLPELVAQGAAAGLDSVAPTVQAGLLSAARGKIRGQTNATFAGIVVYVAGAGVESSGIVSEAIASVRDRNPRHVSVESIQGGGDEEIAVVGTVFTDYQELLETGMAGDKGFLGEMDGYASQLTEAAARGIAGMLR